LVFENEIFLLLKILVDIFPPWILFRIRILSTDCKSNYFGLMLTFSTLSRISSVRDFEIIASRNSAIHTSRAWCYLIWRLRKRKDQALSDIHYSKVPSSGHLSQYQMGVLLNFRINASLIIKLSTQDINTTGYRRELN